MEPIGLAAGIVGLASLFSMWLDVIEKVDTYKDFATDSNDALSRECNTHLAVALTPYLGHTRKVLE